MLELVFGKTIGSYGGNMTSKSLRSISTRVSALAACLLALLAGPARAQLTPSDDAYIDTAAPTVNNGAKTTLGVVSPTQAAYITFDLSSIPSGFTGSSVAKASLKLYVNTVATAGSFNVDYVNGAWVEKTITANNAPPPGSTIAASVPLAKAQAKDYVLIDVTSAVVAWLNGTQTNDGIAIVANSPLSATFDSKESTTQSHPAELDIVFASGGGGGTITGVLTGANSGLTGGGTSGTLNLSLLTSCASKQVLAWTGSAWACSSAGTGTITGVTAGTDLTGGGSSGSVTLNLDVTKVPQLAAANTFTGNQTVNGNLSATGLVTGSAYNIGSNLFAFGSFANSNAYLGFAGTSSGNPGTNNTGVGSNALLLTTGFQNTAVGAGSFASNTNGSRNTGLGYFAGNGNVTTDNTAIGWNALSGNFNGNSNFAGGSQALDSNFGGSFNTGVGMLTLHNNGTGNNNSALGYKAGTDAAFSGLNNTTAIGAFADVAASNSLVLGSINGVNGATADTSVGIGTTAPASALDVEGNMPARSAPILLLKNNAAIQSGANGNAIDLRFAPDGGSGVGNPNAYIRVQEDGNNQYGVFMSFATMADGGAGSGALERIRITANGSVGIGVSSPTHIFQVGQGLGAAFADSWSTYSSRRWKTNIRTLPGALAKVEQLRGVSYDLKGSGKHEIGVIAEEVGQVVPEVVSYEENGKDAQGVDYSRLTALLIEAAKEQQSLIRQQQAQMKVQQAQIARLTSQVKTIEAAMKTSARSGSEVRVIKGPATTIHQ